MKLSARSIALIIPLLLTAIGLCNCGSTSSAGSTSFAYLENSAGGYKSNAAVAAIAGFTRGRKTASGKDLKIRFHKTHMSASGSVNLAAGTVDAYLMDTRTGVAAKLSSQNAMYNGIQLSPDGSKAVFAAFDSAGFSQIFIASVADFNHPAQLTASATADHLCPRFSPDAATIVSTVFTEDANSQAVLAISTIPAAGGTETVIDSSGLQAVTPVFTPDGKKIVFTAAAGSSASRADTGYIDIYVMNLDGTGVTQLSGSTGTYADVLPSVSADGTKILFTRITPSSGGKGYVSNIYVMGMAGDTSANPATQLTTDGYSWNATYVGNTIPFASMKNSPATFTDNIYEMDAAGANQTRLTNSSSEEAFNVFSAF